MVTIGKARDQIALLLLREGLDCSAVVETRGSMEVIFLTPRDETAQERVYAMLTTLCQEYSPHEVVMASPPP